MAIVRNKLHVDKELGLQVKEFRNQYHKKAKDVAAYIEKSAAYISKLEKGEIHQIDKEDFVKMVNYITDSENGYQLFCERIIGAMDPEVLDGSTIAHNFDWIERTLPIPEDYCSYIKKKMHELNVNVRDLADYINLNDDLDKKFLQEQNINPNAVEKNTWLPYYEADSKNIRRNYIIVKISDKEIEEILQQQITKTSYLYLYILLYHIYKLQELNKQLLLDCSSRKKIKKKTIKKLSEYKIYTLADKANAISNVSNEAELENVLNASDVKSQKLMRELIGGISYLAEQDVEYTNQKLECVLANLKNDPSFSLAYMALPLEKIFTLPYNLKKAFLESIKILIDKCSTSINDELERF